MAETIEITRAEYESLRLAAEALADLRSYDAGKAAIVSGDDELIPDEFARRLVAGESPLRVYRQLRGLTQAALSSKAKVSRVQIADIEAGRGKGSLNTNIKLSKALGIDVGDLV